MYQENVAGGKPAVLEFRNSLVHVTASCAMRSVSVCVRKCGKANTTVVTRIAACERKARRSEPRMALRKKKLLHAGDAKDGPESGNEIPCSHRFEIARTHQAEAHAHQGDDYRCHPKAPQDILRAARP